MASVRPMLNPSLTPVWRDGDTLQFGVDAASAVVVAGVTPARAALLRRLDGSVTDAQFLAGARADGVAREAQELLEVLATSGVLVDGGADLRPLSALSVAERDRLAPDLASLACAGAGPDWQRQPAAHEVLARRKSAVVGIRGAGRVGATVVGLLAAAGIGRLDVQDRRPMRPADCAPGGASSWTVPATRAQAALAAVGATLSASAATGVWHRQPATAASSGTFDLVVLCPDGPVVDSGQQQRLAAGGEPHLLATTYERVGVVGPLVVPGRTPCLRCLDLHRVDRDRGWPMVSAQLAAPGRGLGSPPGAVACDVVLATAVAAWAAMTALTFIDCPDRRSELFGAMLELRPPLDRVRRRSWKHHPECGCGWARPDQQGAG